jgi:hypothetical protein
MNRLMCMPGALVGLAALAMLVPACRSDSGKGVSANASAMRLTSGQTEIVMNASKVPGYWATRVGDGEKFFLYTLDRSFRKGEVILVDGTFGTAEAAVFDDDTRVYQSHAPTNIFVVRKAAKADPEKYGRGASGEDRP